MKEEKMSLSKLNYFEEKLPSNFVTLQFDFIFSKEDSQIIKRGYIAECMEEKWDIKFRDNILYFNRSWTGFCVYMIMFEEIDQQLQVSNVLVNRDPKQFIGGSDENELASAGSMIDDLIYRYATPDRRLLPETVREQFVQLFDLGAVAVLE